MIHPAEQGTASGLNQRLSGISLVLIALLATGQACAATWFVDRNAAGLGNGTSWANAFTEVRLALANPALAVGDDIRVAQGIYIPGLLSSDTFSIPNGVILLGGFPTGGGGLGSRQPKVNLTRLSGNIPGPPTSLHVVTFPSGANSTAVLDGFVVEDGDATGGFGAGGGIFIDNPGSPTLKTLLIRDNAANDVGGGLYVAGGSPTITDTIFTNNIARCGFIGATGGGGGMFSQNGSPVLRRVTFDNNRAVFGALPGNESCLGGGFYHGNGYPRVIDTVFENNEGYLGGGGAAFHTRDFTGISEDTSSTPILANVEFRNNLQSRPGGSGGGLVALGGFPNIINGSFVGNTASGGGAISFTGDGGLTLFNSTLAGNVALRGALFTTNSSSAQIDILGSVVAYNLSNQQIYRGHAAAQVTVQSSLVEGSNGSGDDWDFSQGADFGGNIDIVPMFQQIPNPGTDGAWDGANDELGNVRLAPNSPAQDAGGVFNILDVVDIDQDGNTTEVYPLDLAGNPRQAGAVDMGAYEVPSGAANHASISTYPGIMLFREDLRGFTDVIATSKPSASVTVNLATSDTGICTVVSSVNLNSGNGYTQEIAVDGTDDAMITGTRDCWVRVTGTTSADLGYNNLDPEDVPLARVVDDEANRILTTKKYLTIPETGIPVPNSDVFALSVLGSPNPSDSVYVPLTSQNLDTCTVSVAEVELWPGGSPPTGAIVTVSTIDDGVSAGSRDCLITLGPSSSADENFDSLFPVLGGEITDVIVTVTDGSVTAPFVTAVNTIPDTGDGTLAAGEAMDEDLEQLLVTFDQQMNDNPAVGGRVTDAANYLLVRAGTDGTIETTSCVGGAAPTDVEMVLVNPTLYDEVLKQVTLTLTVGAPPLDNYGLFVCGTTSVTNLLGEKLDGNHDGVSGDDFLRDFSIIDTDTDGDGNPDVSDPDDDSDGIQDDLDDQPLVASNLCSGTDALLGVEVSNSQQCAAPGSVTVQGSAAVTSTGDLEIISPRIVFESGFDVALNGEMKGDTRNPCSAVGC